MNDVNDGGKHSCAGAGLYGESLYFRLSFVVNLTLVLKKKKISIKKYGETLNAYY